MKSNPMIPGRDLSPAFLLIVLCAGIMSSSASAQCIPELAGLRVNGRNVAPADTLALIATPGSEFAIQISVRNTGADSPAGYNNLTVCFPHLDSQASVSDIRNGDGTSADLSYHEYFGEVGGGDTYAEWVMVECYDQDGWQGGTSVEVNTLDVRVQAPGTGLYSIYCRAALSHESNWTAMSYLPDHGQNPDCLGFASYRVFIDVSQTAAPAVDVPIVMYHKINTQTPTQYWLHGEEFARQLQLIAHLGMTTIRPAQIFDHMYRGVLLPENPILLIEDDGFLDFYTYAWPLLQQYEFTATVSLISDYVAQEEANRLWDTWETDALESQYSSPHLIWPEVLEMQAGGICFVSHTRSHRALAELSSEDAWDEIYNSKQILEAALGRSVDYLTYPFGSYRESARTSAVQAQLIEAGYEGGIAAWGGMENTATAEIYELRRIYVHRDTNLGQFWSMIQPSIGQAEMELRVTDAELAACWVRLLLADTELLLADGELSSMELVFSEMPRCEYDWQLFSADPEHAGARLLGEGAFCVSSAYHEELLSANLPPATTQLRIVNDEGQLHLNWDAVPDAQYFKVYRCDTPYLPEAEWEYLGQTSGRNWWLSEPEGQAWFRVGVMY